MHFSTRGKSAKSRDLSSIKTHEHVATSKAKLGSHSTVKTEVSPSKKHAQIKQNIFFGIIEDQLKNSAQTSINAIYIEKKRILQNKLWLCIHMLWAIRGTLLFIVCYCNVEFFIFPAALEPFCITVWTVSWHKCFTDHKDSALLTEPLYWNAI